MINQGQERFTTACFRFFVRDFSCAQKKIQEETTYLKVYVLAKHLAKKLHFQGSWHVHQVKDLLMDSLILRFFLRGWKRVHELDYDWFNRRCLNGPFKGIHSKYRMKTQNHQNSVENCILNIWSLLKWWQHIRKTNICHIRKTMFKGK